MSAGHQESTLHELAYALTPEPIIVSQLAHKLLCEGYLPDGYGTITQLKQYVRRSYPPHGQGKVRLAAVQAEHARQHALREKRRDARDFRDPLKRHPGTCFIGCSASCEHRRIRKQDLLRARLEGYEPVNYKGGGWRVEGTLCYFIEHPSNLWNYKLLLLRNREPVTLDIEQYVTIYKHPISAIRRIPAVEALEEEAISSGAFVKHDFVNYQTIAVWDGRERIVKWPTTPLQRI